MTDHVVAGAEIARNRQHVVAPVLDIRQFHSIAVFWLNKWIAEVHFRWVGNILKSVELWTEWTAYAA